MKQEVTASEASVLEVVVASDVERANLLQREASLLGRQKALADGDDDVGDGAQETEALMRELDDVYERMIQIGAATAEARAGECLSLA